MNELPGHRGSARLRRRDDLTFKSNLRQTRYGWLRLTPAYSVHLVSELLDEHWRDGMRVLDPFCGTGTTALVCAERGIECDTTDINPFLLWLTSAKTAVYSVEDMAEVRARAYAVQRAMERSDQSIVAWVPSLRDIDKWWSPRALGALGRGLGAIRVLERSVSSSCTNLLLVAFCRTLIANANVSFGHQSMSFRKDAGADRPDFSESDVAASWGQAVEEIARAAESPVRTVPSAILSDARDLHGALPAQHYDCVITSPPYPNRMSYIRELRPYMYWLGYLESGRQAGELDWQAMGGTWGCATSRLTKWTPDPGVDIPSTGFELILNRIAERSGTLSRYVAKYFNDLVRHCQSLFDAVAPGGTVHYVVGNSKFYDVMVPVEQLYADILRAIGFRDTTLRTIRKRTSKTELFEFVVSGLKP